MNFPRNTLICLVALAACTFQTWLADTPANLLHHRGAAYYIISIAGIAVLAHCRSPYAWLLIGGALANLIDAADGSVEDPFVLTIADSYVAFNLADLVVVAALPLLIVDLGRYCRGRAQTA